MRAGSSQAGSTTSCKARRSSRSPRWTREFVEGDGGAGDGGAGDGADAAGAEGDVLQGAPALLEFGGAFAEGAGAAMRGVGGADGHARETPTSATTGSFVWTTVLDCRPNRWMKLLEVNSTMSQSFLATLIAALLVWEALLLIPMVPGKLIDTRDFAPLPRWQYNCFNVFLTTLGLASFVVAGFALANQGWAFVAALVLGLLYVGVFAADLGEVFPVVPDPIPVQLLVLEAIALASAGVIVVIGIQGMRL
ncbi:hypothetical protein ACF1FX_19600 [Streptomyces sp. NPDC014646]|uniref:hypothetical protein n=1 Tax=unclassified Streptomyces TaxID=2593676 RepID=UPI0036FBD48B